MVCAIISSSDSNSTSRVFDNSEEELKCHICNIEFNANDLETHFANIHHIIKRQIS